MQNFSGRMIQGILFATLACVAATPARAVVVTFDVTGTFGNTCTPTCKTTGVYSGTGGSVSLKYFAPVTFSQDVHQYVDISEGTLQFKVNSPAPTAPVLINDAFTLFISATSPHGTGTASFAGNVSGTYKPGVLGQSGLLTFTGTGSRLYGGVDMATVSIGDLVFGVRQSTALNLGNLKTTDIKGFVTPEPAESGMLAIAVLGLSIFLRRKRA